MSDTTWAEVRRAMQALGDLRPTWPTKCLDADHVSSCHGDGFHRFPDGGCDDDIEWLGIKVTSPAQSASVLAAPKGIHLAGEQTGDGFKVHAHLPIGKAGRFL